MNYLENEMLYEGKAKKIFATDQPNEIVIYYKDEVTAFNAEKKAVLDNKGMLNNQITEKIYYYLQDNGIKTHFIKKLDDRSQLCTKVEIIPLEVIIRNLIAGSMAKRLGIVEGTKPSNTIFEICYKDDALGDPLINDDHAIAMGAATATEIDELRTTALKINTLLQTMFDNAGILLVDFKIEFGRDAQGNILLADEISPDTCRFWDKKTMKKMDKDRFRRDLGDVTQSYREVFERIS